jgi:hypothetical protein
MTLPAERSTLYYYLEVKDGGIIQTYPGTAFEKRRKHVPFQMSIEDLRSVQDDFTLDKNGFQLVPNMRLGEDQLEKETIERVYYPECEKLMKKL